MLWHDHPVELVGFNADQIRFGPYKSIKVRFAGPVIPGQTLVTSMWKMDAAHGGVQKVVFETRVKETGKLVLGAAGVELL